MLGLVLGPLPGFEAGRAPGRGSVGEQIPLAGEGALRLLPAPRSASLRHVACPATSRAAASSAERIEQHPLATLQEELVLVLAMDVHQHLAQLAKLRR